MAAMARLRAMVEDVSAPVIGKGEWFMKKFALVGLGLVGGFAAAMVALPEAKGANDASAYGQLDLFSDAFERVRANYVRPVKDGELIDAAIQGMVSNLDPHSSYMDAKSYGDMQITTKGQFGGVGIEVTQEDGLIKVISPIDGTPASARRHQVGRPHRRHRRRLHRRPAAERSHRQDARSRGQQDHADRAARRRERSPST